MYTHSHKPKEGRKKRREGRDGENWLPIFRTTKSLSSVTCSKRNWKWCLVPGMTNGPFKVPGFLQV